MKRLAAFLSLLLWSAAAQAQFLGEGVWRLPGGGLPPGCSVAGFAKATTYLAAQTGLDATHINAYTTAICGLVADGLFNTIFDGLYFTKNASDANAKVNVINPGTYNLTEHGSCNFVTDGIQGDASTCYEDTGFNPSTATSPNYALNQAFMGVCIMNSRTTASPAGAMQIGSSSNGLSTGGSAGAWISVFGTNASPPGSTSIVLNSETSNGAANTNNAQGNNTLYRLASNAATLLQNGVDLEDFFHATTSVPNANFYLFNVNVDGSPGAGRFTGDTLGYAFFGGGAQVTLANMNQIRSRLGTMLAAIGSNPC